MKQKYNNDCLFACFAKTAKTFHNRKINYNKFYFQIFNDLKPLNIYVAEEYCKYFGISVEVYETENISDLNLGDILMITEDKTNNHFVIFKSYINGKVSYLDPSKGKCEVSEMRFKMIYLQHLIRPNPTNIKVYNEKNIRDNNYNSLVVISNILVGLITTILAIFTTTYLKIIITDIEPNNDYQLLFDVTIIIVVFLVLIEIIKYFKDRLNIKYAKELYCKKLEEGIKKLEYSNHEKRNYRQFFEDIEIISNWDIILSTSFLFNICLLGSLSIFMYIYNLELFILIICTVIIIFFINSIIDEKLKIKLSSRAHKYVALNDWVNIMNKDKQRITNNNDWKWYSKNLLASYYDLNEEDINLEILSSNQLLSKNIFSKLVETLIMFIAASRVLDESYDISLIFISIFVYNYISNSFSFLVSTKSQYESIKLSQSRLSEMHITFKLNKKNIYSLSLQDLKYKKLFNPISSDLIGINELQGNNGVGKSTICNIIKGNIKNHDGKIFINGRPDKICDYRDRILFLSGDDPIYPDTLLSNIFRGNITNRRYDNLFSSINLKRNQIIKTNIDNVSLGQKQIINFIASLNKCFDVLILDEALSNVSKHHRDVLINYLKKNFKNKIVINVGHDYKIGNNVIEVKKWDH